MDGSGGSDAAQADQQLPISSILIIIAMQAEAIPLVNRFQLKEDLDSVFPEGVPWVRYYGTYKDLQVNLVWPGKDSSLGTSGGFKAKGAGVGDVYLVSNVAFHDRRIPIPICELYGVGSRKLLSTPNLVKELHLKVGKLSTGDSLVMSPRDEASITANDAVVKDMEGAAVAYVAELLQVPAILVKAVTDIVDGGDKPTAEEFLQNLAAVTAKLDESVTRVVDFISGKRIADL
ncbi:5'-methylthioadenosine/S-adenosylhomocysteine nucleosidase [Linum perenne]